MLIIKAYGSYTFWEVALGGFEESGRAASTEPSVTIPDTSVAHHSADDRFNFCSP
jgi:hypothetical protein